jgi:hypothetical protein
MSLAIRKNIFFAVSAYASGVNDIKAGRGEVFPATTATAGSMACLHMKSVGLERQLD